MAATNVPQEVYPVEDVEIDMEAKAREYDAQPHAAGDEFKMTTNVQNYSQRRVHMLETHFWHGKSVNDFFPDLEVRYGVPMREVGTLPEGVKWGIAYADGKETTARKFIVAVHGPANKIYVEAGPIGPIDWNVVEVKLDQHSGDKAEVIDPILGGKIVANITGNYGVARFYN